MPLSTTTRILMLVAFAVGLAVALTLRSAPPNPAQPELPQISYGGPFTLVDHTGREVSDTDLRGEYMLVYFGYTHCPDVCPLGLATMTSALRLLGAQAARVRPVFITVDPARDTRERLAGYVSAFHPRMLGLTGTPEQVHAAARAYRILYFAGEVDGRYVVDHSAYTFLMDPAGAYVEHFPHETPPARIAERIRAHMAAAR